MEQNLNKSGDRRGMTSGSGQLKPKGDKPMHPSPLQVRVSTNVREAIDQIPSNIRSDALREIVDLGLKQYQKKHSES